MEGFLFYEATSLPQLFAVVIKLQHILREELQNVKLVIIDSLSNAFEELFQDFGKMVRLQNELMLYLRELVRHYKIMVRLLEGRWLWMMIIIVVCIYFR